MDSYLKLSKLIPNDDAQGLVEYSLILSIVALIVLATIILFGQSVIELYERIIKKMP